MQLWTTRIELDGCGQLAPLAEAVAGLGANIVDLDMHRIGGGRVADDLIIEVPAPIDAPPLGRTLERAGAHVVWLRPADPRDLADRTARALELAAGALNQRDPLKQLGGGAAQLVDAELAWVGPVPVCEPPPLAARALATGTPSRGRLPVKRLPPRREGRWPWAMAVPVDVPGSSRAVVVLVRTNLAFSSTETARVQAFFRLVTTAAAPAAGHDDGAARAAVRLDDGGQVVLRELGPGDAAAVVRLHDRCSELTRYRRYFTPKPRLGPPVLDHLIDVDGRDHVGIAAMTGTEVVGVAHLHRCEDNTDTGEVAVLVEDGHQRRGIGTALLRALLDRAGEMGFERVVALTLPDNEPIARLLHRVASPVHASLADGLRQLSIHVNAHTLVG